MKKFTVYADHKMTENEDVRNWEYVAEYSTEEAAKNKAREMYQAGVYSVKVEEEE